jgi:heptosyltransferase I
MRVLIVKLSSLGDVVHAMPVVHDLYQACPELTIDWVVEPGFAPLVRRVRGMERGCVIACGLRQWRRAWWTALARAQMREFWHALRLHAYDVIIDLQGLSKSGLVAALARGWHVGMGNGTEGSSFERPTRWLADAAVPLPTRLHAMDRSRHMVALTLAKLAQARPGLLDANRVQAAQLALADVPHFGLQSDLSGKSLHKTVAFVHGTSREDKLWPFEHWLALGQKLMAEGWSLALPQGSALEKDRAEALRTALLASFPPGATAALSTPKIEVWPSMALDSVVDRMAATQGVIGVDSGLSHIAVALNLPHVQIYNFPTAWRTGPQRSHGHLHQVSVQGEPTPAFEAVWQAWQGVMAAASTTAVAAASV